MRKEPMDKCFPFDHSGIRFWDGFYKTSEKVLANLSTSCSVASNFSIYPAFYYDNFQTEKLKEFYS